MQICYYISKSNLAFKIYKKYICGFSPISKYDFLYIFTKNIKWLIYIKINLSNKITKSKRGEDVMVEAVFTIFYKLGDELKNGGEETGSELFNKENNTKEDNRSSKYSDKEIIAKANRNVENEASGRYSGSSSNSSNTSDNGLGVRYNKGRGVPKNFKKAEDSFRDYKNMKKNSGLGINSKIGIGAAIFFQAATMDLSNLKNIIEVADKTKSSLESNNQNNYPYNVMRAEQIGKAGGDLFKDGLKSLVSQLTAAPILNAETGSMNEATKGNAYYGDGSAVDKSRNNYRKPLYNLEVGKIQGNNYINNTSLLGTNNMIETYINNLENLNRNNPNKILSQQYNRPEDISNIIKNFHKKTQ